MAKAKTKQKTKPKSRVTRRAPSKRVKRKSVAARKRPAQVKKISLPEARVSVSTLTALAQSPVFTHREPISHFGVRLLSLVLLLLAALTSSVTVALAGYDMQQSTEQAQSDLSRVEPKEYLYKVASEKNLDYDLLARIAFCESSWRMVPNARSSAYGYFQILDATERHTPQFEDGKRKFDPITNIDMAVYLYERYGTFPWSESKSCWRWASGE